MGSITAGSDEQTEAVISMGILHVLKNLLVSKKVHVRKDVRPVVKAARGLLGGVASPLGGGASPNPFSMPTDPVSMPDLVFIVALAQSDECVV